MKCFSCDKFIKRGHGTQIWYHPNPSDIRRVGVRGENRYYCPLCLKVKDYWEKMNRERYKYLIKDEKSTSFSLIALIIAGLLFFYLEKYRQLILIISLIIIPLLVILDFNNYQEIKKKNKVIAIKRAELWKQYEKFKSEQWRPIGAKKEEIRRIKFYLKSKYQWEEFCHCIKCLESEYKKRKII